MPEQMTWADALAIRESILRAPAHEERWRLASQFEAEVHAAIESESCTNPEYCLEVLAELWFEIRRRKDEAGA